MRRLLNPPTSTLLLLILTFRFPLSAFRFPLAACRFPNPWSYIFFSFPNLGSNLYTFTNPNSANGV